MSEWRNFLMRYYWSFLRINQKHSLENLSKYTKNFQNYTVLKFKQKKPKFLWEYSMYNDLYNVNKKIQLLKKKYKWTHLFLYPLYIYKYRCRIWPLSAIKISSIIYHYCFFSTFRINFFLYLTHIIYKTLTILNNK